MAKIHPSAGNFSSRKQQHHIEEVQDTEPLQYVIKNRFGATVSGPYMLLEEAEAALNKLDDIPKPP